VAQLNACTNHTIVVSKSCCPVCWELISIFNRRAQDPKNDKVVSFTARGRHANLYPVDLPDVLDDDIKDELVTSFSIILLNDLVYLSNKRSATTKHNPSDSSDSSVSQPESLALSLDSILSGSADADTAQDNYTFGTERRKKLSRHGSVESKIEMWRHSDRDCDPDLMMPPL
jgi:hypothetical protein